MGGAWRVCWSASRKGGSPTAGRGSRGGGYRECFFGRVRAAKFFRAQFRGQGIPFELRLDAVSSNARHRAPVVDAAGRAGRHTGHAEVANIRVDHIVARIMRDRADRAGRLAGVAADADLGVDQVLPDDFGLGRLCHTLVLEVRLLKQAVFWRNSGLILRWPCVSRALEGCSSWRRRRCETACPSRPLRGASGRGRWVAAGSIRARE